MPYTPQHTSVTWFAHDMISVSVYAVAVLVPIVLTVVTRLVHRYRYVRELVYSADEQSRDQQRK